MKHEPNQTDTRGNELNPLLCPVIIEEEDDWDIEEEPDCYMCMCCGNVQQSSKFCGNCCSPVYAHFL